MKGGAKPRRKRFGPAPKPAAEKYKSIAIRLHPMALEWAKQEAKRSGLGYQTVINNALLETAAGGRA